MSLRAVLLGIVIALAAPAARAEVLVFAAASLKEPLDAIAAQFDGVVVSYGGSGTLARQVSLGAPADIVLLANSEWMDVLVSGQHVDNESVVEFASNRLVLIGQKGTAPLVLESFSLMNALGDGRIAVGLTQAVPAGIYAKAGLVARGQTPLGIVYRTDTRVSDAIVELAEFPLASHPPIQYRGALIDAENDEASSVLAFLTSEEGQLAIASFGFLPPLDAVQ